MVNAFRVLLASTLVAVGLLGGAGVAAADQTVSCAGITEIPGGSILASDKNGNAILITSSGAVIRCDGSGTFPSLAAADAGQSTPLATHSTFMSSVSFPGDASSWTMTQATLLPGTNEDLVGMLGSNADQTIVFWRSAPGGPVETWINDAMFVP